MSTNPANEQGEYYLTDCPAILTADGKRVIAVKTFDVAEAMGVNTPEQLAEVERLIRQQSGKG
ncbi:MAG: hypothetical protein IH998_14445 [Proteobacteria bacterium]|nr:hypothetical protein [Pseudomonadota bacterium]